MVAEYTPPSELDTLEQIYFDLSGVKPLKGADRFSKVEILDLIRQSISKQQEGASPLLVARLDQLEQQAHALQTTDENFTSAVNTLSQGISATQNAIDAETFARNQALFAESAARQAAIQNAVNAAVAAEAAARTAAIAAAVLAGQTGGGGTVGPGTGGGGTTDPGTGGGGTTDPGTGGGGTTDPGTGGTGGNTGGGSTLPDPGPVPARVFMDRSGKPVRDRTGAYVQFRAPTVIVDPGGVLVPVDVPPPTGAVLDRTGKPLLDRNGRYLFNRTAPDVNVSVPVPDPVQEIPPVVLPPVVWPTGPHIRLTSLHANCIIEYQNGTKATIRLKRPLYVNNHLFQVDCFNNGANGQSNTFWSNTFGYLGIQDWNHAAVNRDILSTDDGTFGTQVFAGMNDGTFLALDLTWLVSPLATGVPPGASPVPNRLEQVFFEDFLPGTGTGALSRASGPIVNTGKSTILMMGGACSAMTQTSVDYRDRGNFGFGNGRYEFRVRYFGNDIGDGAGPCSLLWPSSDVWPGPEVDLGELMSDGTFYSALHWKDATRPVEGNQQNRASIWPMPKTFNFREWFTTGCDIDNSKIIFHINGTEFARDDFNPAPKDFANGGENHTVGLLSQSNRDNSGNPSGLECDWIRWTPTSLLP